MDNSTLYSKLLYGADETKNIVAVEDTADGRIILFIRTVSGIIKEERFFKPWFLISDLSLIADLSIEHKITELKSGYYKYKVECNSRHEFWKIRDYIVYTYNNLHNTGLTTKEYR